MKPSLANKIPDEGIIHADEVTLAFFRKYLEMPKGTLEDLCREIIRLKKPKERIEELDLDPDKEYPLWQIQTANKLNQIIRLINKDEAGR